MPNKPKVVIIGGGTGSYTLLKDLKNLPINISAIVNMSDNGGSTGILHDELGVLPPGDIRQCLVALSTDPEIRELFNYRFESGSLKGQSLGNIILSGLSLKFDNFAKAIEISSKILQIKGRVIPITLDHHTLYLKDGISVICGEKNITNHRFINKSVTLYHQPKTTINPLARQAINQANIIVIAPGNLFSSLLPILTVDNVAKIIKNSKAKIILVTNLVTKPGQTDNWSVKDYIDIFEKYLGKSRLDYVLYNTKLPTNIILKSYAKEDEHPVKIDLKNLQDVKAKLIAGNFLSNEIKIQNPVDLIARTLIRHNGKKISKVITKILGENLN